MEPQALQATLGGVINTGVTDSIASIVALQIPELPALRVIQKSVTKDEGYLKLLSASQLLTPNRSRNDNAFCR